MRKTVEIAQFLLFAVDGFNTKLYNTSMSMLNFTQFLTYDVYFFSIIFFSRLAELEDYV